MPMKRSCLALILLVLLAVQPALVWAQSTDKDAPEIQGVTIEQVSETSVTVTWETDEDADSAVNYGRNCFRTMVSTEVPAGCSPRVPLPI